MAAPANASDNPLALLSDLAQVRMAKLGETLVVAGAEAQGFYRVVTGSVRIYQLSTEGREVEVGRFGPGDFVAAALAFSEEPFPHFLEAVEDSRLLFYPRAVAWQRIIATPPLASFFLRMISGKCRVLQQRIHALEFQTPRERLLAYLGQLCPRDGSCVVRLPRPKKDIARMLGTTPETLSRTLRALEQDGTIKMEARSIRLGTCRLECKPSPLRQS